MACVFFNTCMCAAYNLCVCYGMYGCNSILNKHTKYIFTFSVQNAATCDCACFQLVFNLHQSAPQRSRLDMPLILCTCSLGLCIRGNICFERWWYGMDVVEQNEYEWSAFEFCFISYHWWVIQDDQKDYRRTKKHEEYLGPTFKIWSTTNTL